jgi:hypothetical protein
MGIFPCSYRVKGVGIKGDYKEQTCFYPEALKEAGSHAVGYSVVFRVCSRYFGHI